MERIINIATENIQVYFFIQIHKQTGIVSLQNSRLQTERRIVSPCPPGPGARVKKTKSQPATSILTYRHNGPKTLGIYIGSGSAE